MRTLVLMLMLAATASACGRKGPPVVEGKEVRLPRSSVEIPGEDQDLPVPRSTLF